MTLQAFDTPRLLADVGGTFARFVLETAPGVFEQADSLRCADFADLASAIRAYLDARPSLQHIRHAAVAIANPVDGDLVRMTNYHWQFSIEALRAQLALDTLVVVNDFTALAMALPRLGPQQLRQVGGGSPRARSVMGLLGAGSGLGMSGLIPADHGWVALGTEGGHASFAPRDERELEVLRHAMRQHDHVSFERLLSASGLELIHRALAARGGRTAEGPGAPEITRRALAGSDPLCVEALETFCAMLGTAAANLAVTLGAFGGIYIGGGIVPRLGEFFARSPFRARFEDKGRFSDYLRRIPTFVITAEHATFSGTSAILAAQLQGLQATADPAIIEQIQRLLPSLSPAERRVGEYVLARSRSALNEPIADIADAAGVSQPTVIRFCRSLGCKGLSDFKLRLASGLTGTVPLTHAQVTDEDSTMELGAKVLGNTAAAILQVREHLNRDAIERVIDLVSDTGRVEFFAVGHYGVVAQDAQNKFLRFGISAGCCTDGRLQALAAGAMRPGEVAVLISGTGHTHELLAVAERLRERGTVLVAITPPQTPLAKRADVALIVDHVEDVRTQLPMVSRILYLLVIDILAVGVALRRHALDAADAAEMASSIEPAQARRLLEAVAPRPTPAPGVSASTPLTRLIPHSRS